MYDEMKRAGIPLYALESGDSVHDFDVVAFSIGYEMAYTTVLDMLGMSGIPIRSADRPDLLPLVIAGGSSSVNAEPMTPFIDLFILGEGEEVNNELLTLLRQAKREGWSKHDFLLRATELGGIYVPSLYDVDYNDDGTTRCRTRQSRSSRRRRSCTTRSALSCSAGVCAAAAFVRRGISIARYALKSMKPSYGKG